MKILSTIVSIALFTGFAVAQDTPDMSAPKEMDRFKHLAGTWKGKEKFMEPGKTEPTELSGTYNNSMALNGHYMRGEYSTVFPGPLGPYNGLMMVSYDPGTKKYLLYWFDSWSNQPLKGTSTTVTDSQIVFVTEPTTMMEGAPPSRTRITFTFKSAAEYALKVEMEMGPDFVTFLEGTYAKQ